MFDNMVIGVDDQERGRDALTLAQELRSCHSTIALVHVEVLQIPPSPDTDTRFDEECQRFGVERLQRLRDATQIDAEVARIRATSVRRGLHEFSAARDADVIVIGAGSPNPIEQMFLGDEAREVLDDAPCAVAIAPRGYAARAHQLRTIGVAYDGSAPGTDAFAAAKAIAAQHQAALSAFEALHPPPHARDIWNVEYELDELVENAQRQIASFGDVEPHAAIAEDTVEALRQFAASVDLLVLGAHEYRPPDRFLHLPRTTSQHLAVDPPSPLLVLAPAQQVAGREAGQPWVQR